MNVESVLRTISDIQNLTRVADMQNALMKSSVMQASMEDVIEHIAMQIQAVAKYFDEATQAVKYFDKIDRTTYQVLTELRQSVQTFVDQYKKIDSMIRRPVPIQMLIPELEAINQRSEIVRRSLYNYIAILEKELEEKKNKIRELRRRLNEMKKRLEPSYIV